MKPRLWILGAWVLAGAVWIGTAFAVPCKLGCNEDDLEAFEGPGSVDCWCYDPVRCVILGGGDEPTRQIRVDKNDDEGGDCLESSLLPTVLIYDCDGRCTQLCDTEVQNQIDEKKLHDPLPSEALDTLKGAFCSGGVTP